MKARYLKLIVVIAAALVIGVIWWRQVLHPPVVGWQGYVEADFVKVGPTQQGLLTRVYVQRGDRIEKEALLFEQDDGADQAALKEAKAAKIVAEEELKRAEALKTTGFTTKQRLDQLVADRNSAQARLEAAQWRLDQRRMRAPIAGVAADVLARAGETIQAGATVVSILPPENIFVRFFVPEPDLSGLSIGNEVQIRCDGCSDSIKARVTFVSPRAEYTPPLIYSVNTRAKLVYLIEATPENKTGIILKPGQPVEVRRE